MAGKKKAVEETVRLTSPQGTRVTVGRIQAEALKARGYKGVPGRPAQSSQS